MHKAIDAIGEKLNPTFVKKGSRKNESNWLGMGLKGLVSVLFFLPEIITWGISYIPIGIPFAGKPLTAPMKPMSSDPQHLREILEERRKSKFASHADVQTGDAEVIKAGNSLTHSRPEEKAQLRKRSSTLSVSIELQQSAPSSPGVATEKEKRKSFQDVKDEAIAGQSTVEKEAAATPNTEPSGLRTQPEKEATGRPHL